MSVLPCPGSPYLGFRGDLNEQSAPDACGREQGLLGPAVQLRQRSVGFEIEQQAVMFDESTDRGLPFLGEFPALNRKERESIMPPACGMHHGVNTAKRKEE